MGPVRSCGMVFRMEEWLLSVAAVVTTLIGIAALIVSIRASQRVKRKRETEILLEDNHREARERQERIDCGAANREDLFD